MRKVKKFLKVGVFLFIILGMLVPASIPVVAEDPRLSPALMEMVGKSTDQMVRVIVQKANRTISAESFVEKLGGLIINDLHIINAFAAEIPVRALVPLSTQESVQWVSLDAPVESSYGTFETLETTELEDFTDDNTFLETTYAYKLHYQGITGQGITVAVIDSGIGMHDDLDGRIIVAPEYGTGDLYGHGTHVAGIIGGSGSAEGGLFRGVAPGANLISLGISDENGMGYESDVVEALQWVNDNKDTYNIRVVNLSLNSTVEDSYHNSPIDAAVEILWFRGVVIVASVGNKGPAGGHNTAKTAPANDPFIIAVGASDEFDTSSRGDDSIAPFSSHGITVDGHKRPDIIAPGYNIYSALSPDSSWKIEFPERVVSGEDADYIRLSGTSMAAPVVSGTVALLLQDEPNLTPDQVKYRLLNPSAGSNWTFLNESLGGYPYLNVYAVVYGNTTQEANVGLTPHMLLAKMVLIAYWSNENVDDSVNWDSVNWDSVNWDSVNWDSVNWDSVNWDSVNWDSVNWDSVNWDSVNWNSVNWNSVNWNSVNWNSVNWNSVNWNSVQLNGIFWGKGRDKSK
jgi:serine protease AprX